MGLTGGHAAAGIAVSNSCGCIGGATKVWSRILLVGICEETAIVKDLHCGCQKVDGEDNQNRCF